MDYAKSSNSSSNSIEDYTKELYEKIEILLGKTPNIPKDVSNNKPTFYPFKLPIQYLEDKSLHALSPIVSSDLELSPSLTHSSSIDASSNQMVIYDHLFQPTHSFAKDMIKEWNRQYTTNTHFLTDSQSVINLIGMYKSEMAASCSYKVDCAKMMTIWKDTKEDKNFLEKYSYMDWKMLDYLNKSPQFLQILSIANITSPLMSLLVPILFLILPFVILKIQGIPISMNIYIDTLKGIAKNHFIGKTLLNLQTISWDKIIYVSATFCLYLMQIYQNVNSCFRFYRNVNKVNDQLCEMREYLTYSVKSMETFIRLNIDRSTYSPFLADIRKHVETMKKLKEELESIQPFIPHIGKLFTKVWEVGYILKCYYELYSNQEYADSLQFSFGFEGYMNNLSGIHANVVLKKVAFAKFAEVDQDSTTEFKDQYYPPYKDGEYSVNDCMFSKNMIITGPNASGKTTLLKTTTLNIIFSQQVGCGFYSDCTLTPYTHIHSYLNIPDTSGRDSLFQAESRRCKDILDIINSVPMDTSRHFCIFDELYSGTNPEEATKSAYSFLLYLANFKNVNFILTTHYISICKKLKKSKTICNYKMNVLEKEGKLTYTYKMKKGISKIQGAIRILEDMNYPDEILQSVKSYV